MAVSETLGRAGWLPRGLMLAVLVCVGGLHGRSANAATPSSASFRVYGDGLNLLAGESTSTSFTVRGCLGPGPEAAGSASSASFKVQIGCVEAFAGLPADDDDGDGVPNAAEDGVGNDGDGNGDGIADRTQGNVTSLPAAYGPGYLTIQVPEDGSCGQLLDVHAVNPSTLGSDPGFVYPYGMIAFRIEPCSGPVPVTVFLHGAGSVETYRKFGHMAPDFISAESFYTMPATFGTAVVGTQTVRTITFSLSDNALGDNSPVAMQIIDPSGPARRSGTVAPVLPPSGLAICVLLLMAAAAFQLRRSRRGGR